MGCGRQCLLLLLPSGVNLRSAGQGVGEGCQLCICQGPHVGIATRLGVVKELKTTAAASSFAVPDSALPPFNLNPPVALQVALVGAPNVGKSSLVQLLSSGLPEVQNYPFTTRSIKMGHFYVAGRRHQVTGGWAR